MTLEIVWVPIDANSPLGLAIGDPTVVLPHYAENASDSPRSLKTTLNARTLALGILVTTSESRIVFGSRPTDEHLRTALRFASADIGTTSEDELCVDAASHLREQGSPERAVQALRRAIEILPDAQLCRGDLITGLFMGLSDPTEATESAIRYIAQLFLEWQTHDTTCSGNEELVFYCGFAVLAYLGRHDELAEFAAQHRSRCDHFPWLSEQIVRLRTALPHRLSEIAFEGTA